jgi:YidC/Oxa1 family membrane protein insertase
MTEQRNLLLAVLLSMIVVFGWQYFVIGPQMQEERARQAELQAQQQVQQEAQGGVPGVASPNAQPLSRAEAIGQSGARVEIATPSLDGSINLTGGRFDDLRLRKYRATPDPQSPEIELLSPLGSLFPWVSEHGWVARSGENQSVPTRDTQWTLAQGSTLSPGNDIELTYDNGTGLTFTRRISVDANYMFTIADTVDNHGMQPVSLAPYAMVLRANPPGTTKFWVLHEGFVGVFNGTLNDPTYDTLAKDNQIQSFESTGGWAGITDKYWMAAVIPPQSDKFTATYKAFDANNGKAYQADYVLPERTIPPNGSQTVLHRFFAGAKVVDLVDNYQTSLGIQRFDLAVDWGWFLFLTKPIFQALDLLYRLVGNFGVAILIFTVFVKLLFFPLANTSYRAMSKMKKLQPEMERIRERFKDDKVQQQQALMKLYQEEKVNPLAGCLPMLIQIPVFFSLYKVLVVTIDMRHAPFFGWIKDLSAPDPTTIFNLFGLIPWDPGAVPGIGQFLMLGVFPIIMGVTMWVQTSLNPPPADPVQQKIFSYMPIMFTFMLSGLPAGLVIYWAWNNFLSIIQQVTIMRSTGAPIEILDRLLGKAKPPPRAKAPE